MTAASSPTFENPCALVFELGRMDFPAAAAAKAKGSVGEGEEGNIGGAGRRFEVNPRSVHCAMLDQASPELKLSSPPLDELKEDAAAKAKANRIEIICPKLRPLIDLFL